MNPISKLRIAFMGTPAFSVPALQAIRSAGYELVAVYCQPAKPAGRGQHIQKSPVELAAEDMGISVFSPRSLREVTEQKIFSELNLDVAVVAAYGLILPQAILSAPRLGCINIHGSLLPRWRGAAPIQRSILAGDTETGITIMQMEAGLDTGPMLLMEKCPITTSTTAGSLHDTLAQMGAKLIISTLEGLTRGTLKTQIQPSSGVLYAAKLTRGEGQIDWTKSALEIDRQVRAFQPWPGSFFTCKDESIKVLAVEIVEELSMPRTDAGTIIHPNFTVACGEGALRLLTVQRAGKKAIDGAAFLNGQRLEVGFNLVDQTA